MADNTPITAGSGTSIATDDIGSVFYQRVKVSLGADGTATDWLGDATNGARVTPSVRKTRIAVTPTCSTSAYAVGDQVGGLMTFSNSVLSSGGTGTVTGASITNRAANTVIPELDLILFEASPTVASVDNGAADLTDANLESARVLPVITFAVADYCTLANNTVNHGTLPGGAIDFVTSGSASLFGILVTRTIFTLASTTDIVVALRIIQD
jgi:hypothetical protein